MFKNFTALYVEDESQIKVIVASVLSGLFKEFLLASDGEEGLNLFTEHKDDIDLVITDINMPNMNGLDMCSKIREINHNIPIIITTAHNDKDFLHKAIDLGVSKFVTKPMVIQKLLAKIKEVLKPIILQQELDDELKQHQEERLQSAKFAATGQLAAGITHEINTPLTYIKANFEMMGYDIEDLEDSKIKDNISTSLLKISDGIHRIENIVGSMKEMSVQSSDTKEDTNIYSSIITASILAYNKIKHISHVYINGKVFNLDIDKNEFEYTAKVQLQRIEQVWIIIINNAMDELMKIDNFKDRRLDIDIVSTDTHVVVTFKDNAGGIKNDIVEHLFEPFKGTKESSGMGVGLSIAKRIVEDQNNATISAFNEENGAVFKIELSK